MRGGRISSCDSRLRPAVMSSRPGRPDDTTPLRPRPRVRAASPRRPRNALDVHPRRDAGERLLRRPTDATGGDAAELRAGAARGVAQGTGDAGAKRGAVRVAHGVGSCCGVRRQRPPLKTRHPSGSVPSGLSWLGRYSLSPTSRAERGVTSALASLRDLCNRHLTRREHTQLAVGCVPVKYRPRTDV